MKPVVPPTLSPVPGESERATLLVLVIYPMPIAGSSRLAEIALSGHFQLVSVDAIYPYCRIS